MENKDNPKFWIARDKNDNLYLYYDKPLKCDDYFSATETYDGKPFPYSKTLPKSKLPNNIFPEITFENSPKEIELREPLPEPKNLLLEYPWTEIRLHEGQLYKLIGIVEQGRADMVKRIENSPGLKDDSKEILLNPYKEMLEILWTCYNDLKKKYGTEHIPTF